MKILARFFGIGIGFSTSIHDLGTEHLGTSPIAICHPKSYP